MKFEQYEPIRKCTIPLMTEITKDIPTQIGTGILVTYNNNYYLVSASHVFMKVTNNKIIVPYSNVCIGIGGNTKYFNKQGQPTGQFGDNIYNELKQDDIFLIYGYPSSRFKVIPGQKKAKGEALIFRGKVADKTVYDNNSNLFTVDANIVIEYDRDKTINITTGKKVKGIQLNGVSGCGVWYFIGNKDDNKILLASILIEYHEEIKMISSTRFKNIYKKIIDEPTIFEAT